LSVKVAGTKDILASGNSLSFVPQYTSLAKQRYTWIRIISRATSYALHIFKNY
jgi:hypothetical protein